MNSCRPSTHRDTSSGFAASNLAVLCNGTLPLQLLVESIGQITSCDPEPSDTERHLFGSGASGFQTKWPLHLPALL
jgi:hypothetical protein